METGTCLFDRRDENIDEDLPDRIVNPDMYQPLLQATNNGEGSILKCMILL